MALFACQVALAAEHKRVMLLHSFGYSAGQAVLKLLQRAAGAAEANSRQALETAQKLSNQLRIAEDRIAELEAEIQHYREKSERAEEWLRKIFMEIKDRLVNEPEEKRRQMSRRG